MLEATVEGLFIVPSVSGAPQSMDDVTAVPGRGLEGDRYFAGEGTFYEDRKGGQDLTLIEAEAIEGLAREHGIRLGPGESRRNVVTRGIGLNDLVGRRFRVGDAECVGRRLCDPCSHLEKLTEPGVLEGLVNRGGLRADILSPGRISVGDEVVDLGAA